MPHKEAPPEPPRTLVCDSKLSQNNDIIWVIYLKVKGLSIKYEGGRWSWKSVALGRCMNFYGI